MLTKRKRSSEKKKYILLIFFMHAEANRESWHENLKIGGEKE